MAAPYVYPQTIDAAATWEAALAAVRGYCGWHIAPVVTETVTVDGSGSGTLLLPTLRLTALVAVTDDTTLLVDGTDFEWSPSGMVRRATGYWWTQKYRAVTVTMTHGYQFMPDEVMSVIQAVATRAGLSPTGIVQRQAGPFGESYSRTSVDVAGRALLMDFERAQLAQYRVPPRL